MYADHKGYTDFKYKDTNWFRVVKRKAGIAILLQTK